LFYLPPRRQTVRRSSSLVLLGLVAACSPRTLALVELYSDGASAPTSIDGNSGDSSNSISSDGRPAPTSIDGDLGDSSHDAPPPSVSAGLVGLWHFDDGVGSQVARDSSGNSNHGTLVGLDPAQAWVAGRWGGALATNGVGYATVPQSASIYAIATGVTVSAWVYLDGVIAANGFGVAIARQVRLTDLQYYHLSLTTGGVPSLSIGLSPKVIPFQALATTPIAPRTWTHLAGTYDGKVAVLYVDGVTIDSTSYAGLFNPDSITPVLLGANGGNAGTGDCFPGRIDEIALYDRALSPEEIRLLATAPP